jgi:hypothetical protein
MLYYGLPVLAQQRHMTRSLDLLQLNKPRKPWSQVGFGAVPTATNEMWQRSTFQGRCRESSNMTRDEKIIPVGSSANFIWSGLINLTVGPPAGKGTIRARSRWYTQFWDD